jgi:uncharacterized protein (DUF1697 family)
MAGAVQIALLRAVMPTGKNKVPMAVLRTTLAGLGFTDVRTILASGNAIFRSPGPAGPELESILEDAIAKHIGPRLDVLVRDASAWARIVAGNPFPDDSAAIPSRVLATVFKTAPNGEAALAFEAAVTGPERARFVGDVLWAVYPEGVAGSNLTPAFFKRHLGPLVGTARNWNTVRKLQEVAFGMAEVGPPWGERVDRFSRPV